MDIHAPDGQVSQSKRNTSLGSPLILLHLLQFSAHVEGGYYGYDPQAGGTAPFIHDTWARSSPVTRACAQKRGSCDLFEQGIDMTESSKTSKVMIGGIHRITLLQCEGCNVGIGCQIAARATLS